MGFITVPTISMMNMGISAAIAIFLPIVLLIMWKQKKHVKLSPFFIGALIFIVFALVLESICHQFFLVKDSALSRFMNGNTVAYVLYASFAAGIFEETGRFIAFKLFLKKENGKETSITYGIGHGGIESILLVGLSMVSTLFLVYTLNTMGGMDAYLAKLPAETQEILQPSLAALYTTSPILYLIGGLERVAAIVLHIALSVFVFFAAKRSGKLYLYPAAIVLHAFVNVFAALYQKQIINVAITEIAVFVFTALIAYAAYRLYQNDKPQAEMAIEPATPTTESIIESDTTQ